MEQRSNNDKARQRKRGQGKQKILEVARRLFITRGVDTVSYGDIAEEVGATRANIHYHYGQKTELVSAVFAITFDEVQARLAEIWLSPNVPLLHRLDLLFADAQSRYEEFNTAENSNVPWSLSSRVYLGFSSTQPEVFEGIHVMSAYFEEVVTHAVQLAVGKGELEAGTPVDDVVLMITPLWHFGSPITQFSGLQRLQNHYSAVKRMITEAYGMTPNT